MKAHIPQIFIKFEAELFHQILKLESSHIIRNLCIGLIITCIKLFESAFQTARLNISYNKPAGILNPNQDAGRMHKT